MVLLSKRTCIEACQAYSWALAMTYIHDPVSHNSALPHNISGGTPTALKAALGKSNVAAMLITWRYKVYLS